METKIFKRQRRKNRIRGKVSGTAKMPRLSVYRSNAHIYGQLIDDEKGVTICSICDIDFKDGTNVEKSTKAGKSIAELAQKSKIKKIVFDRNGYKYHGRIKAFADGAREGGLEF